jgi:hypothetical protein
VFTNLLKAKLTRKEFLSILGMLMITVFGVSSFLKNLKNIPGLNPTKSKVTKNVARSSFGHGSYGV